MSQFITTVRFHETNVFFSLACPSWHNPQQIQGNWNFKSPNNLSFIIRKFRQNPERMMWLGLHLTDMLNWDNRTFIGDALHIRILKMEQPISVRDMYWTEKTDLDHQSDVVVIRIRSAIMDPFLICSYGYFSICFWSISDKPSYQAFVIVLHVSGLLMQFTTPSRLIGVLSGDILCIHLNWLPTPCLNGRYFER